MIMVDSDVCGVSSVTKTLSMERHIAVEFFQ